MQVLGNVQVRRQGLILFSPLVIIRFYFSQTRYEKATCDSHMRLNRHKGGSHHMSLELGNKLKLLNWQQLACNTWEPLSTNTIFKTTTATTTKTKMKQTNKNRMSLRPNIGRQDLEIQSRPPDSQSNSILYPRNKLLGLKGWSVQSPKKRSHKKMIVSVFPICSHERYSPNHLHVVGKNTPGGAGCVINLQSSPLLQSRLTYPFPEYNPISGVDFPIGRFGLYPEKLG